MCRWAAYKGPSVWLEDVIINPCRSLLWQSSQACEAKTTTHADGLGLAWYNDGRDAPALYRNTVPAWSDPNLESLCHNLKSHLFLAHIRAATDGETATMNCHPFVSGKWSFMHNGQIGSFSKLKRPLEAKLSDASYAARKGTTDSELFFLMLLDAGLDQNPQQAIINVITSIYDVCEAEGVKPHLRLTCALSDGDALYGLRYATDRFAPTLYVREDADLGGFSFVSEPLDEAQDTWIAAEPSTLSIIDNNGLSTLVLNLSHHQKAA